jgi:hypothetical protein
MSSKPDPNVKIGDRPLTEEESKNCRILGLTADQVKDMTPADLAWLADEVSRISPLFLGS